MTMLMMLAFLIDQVQQLSCKVYQQTRKHVGKLNTLFEDERSLIKFGVWNCWLSLYRFIGDPAGRSPPSENGWVNPFLRFGLSNALFVVLHYLSVRIEHFLL